MGTDINMVVERFWKGKWIAKRTLHSPHTWEEEAYFLLPSLKRNYERFDMLRKQGPVGLPEDVSETSRYLYEDDGGYGPSWIPLTKAIEIFRLTEVFNLPEDAKQCPEDFYFGVSVYEPCDCYENYRLVFWFD